MKYFLVSLFVGALLLGGAYQTWGLHPQPQATSPYEQAIADELAHPQYGDKSCRSGDVPEWPSGLLNGMFSCRDGVMVEDGESPTPRDLAVARVDYRHAKAFPQPKSDPACGSPNCLEAGHSVNFSAEIVQSPAPYHIIGPECGPSSPGWNGSGCVGQLQTEIHEGQGSVIDGAPGVKLTPEAEDHLVQRIVHALKAK